MRNLLALIGLATVTFVGLGWYLGWYKLEKGGPSQNGGTTVNVDLNSKKIGADIQTGAEKVGEFINSFSSKSKPTTESSWYDPAPAPKPAPQTSWYSPAPATQPAANFSNAARIPQPPQQAQGSWYNPPTSPGWRVITPSNK